VPENAGGLVTPALIADPAVVGALRMDVVSAEPGYRHAVRQALYGDLSPDAAGAAIALLTPDAPAGIGTGTTTLTATGWGSVPRTYVMCERGMAIRPALQRRFIAEADAAFPGNRTTVHTLDAAHSPFLSVPGQVADIVLKIIRGSPDAGV
jgi:hypothetical protein